MSDVEPRPQSEGLHRLLLTTIDTKPIPTIDDICQEIGSTIDKLPTILEQRAIKILQYCDQNSIITDDELSPRIDFIYRCYLATRGVHLTPQIYTFSHSLSGFDEFTRRYGEGFAKKAIANFIKRNERFMYTVIHPSRILLAFPETHRLYGKRSIYNTSGEWFRLPMVNEWSPHTYVERNVIDEIITLQDTMHRSPDVYHATGSAALAGIAKHKSLLSARKAKETGLEVKTGEYVGYINWDGYSVSGGKEGLSYIYTSQSPHTGYSMFRWFDEYPVVFGLSKAKIKKYLSDSRSNFNPSFENYSGEGITIGPDAPLSIVDTLYTEFIHLDELKKWQQLHAPHAQVLSLEANELIRNQKIDSPYFPQKKINWRALLQQRPVILPT